MSHGLAWWHALLKRHDERRPTAKGAGAPMCPIYYLFIFDAPSSSLLRKAQLDSHELKHTGDETTTGTVSFKMIVRHHTVSRGRFQRKQMTDSQKARRGEPPAPSADTQPIWRSKGCRRLSSGSCAEMPAAPGSQGSAELGVPGSAGLGACDPVPTRLLGPVSLRFSGQRGAARPQALKRGPAFSQCAERAA